MTTHSGLAASDLYSRRMADSLGLMLRDRRALALVGLVAVAAGLAWQWTWLAAIGAAPILVSVAPCAAMCALGQCMTGRAGRFLPLRPNCC